MPCYKPISRRCPAKGFPPPGPPRFGSKQLNAKGVVGFNLVVLLCGVNVYHTCFLVLSTLEALREARVLLMESAMLQVKLPRPTLPLFDNYCHKKSHGGDRELG